MNAVTMTEKLHDCRDAFVSVLERLGAENSKIVAVCNDSVGSSKLGGFKSKWPDRLVNVGIAEQTVVAVGAGLANGGKVPFVSAAACFLTGRALEQIKADIAASVAALAPGTDRFLVMAVLPRIVSVGVLAAQRVAVVRHHDGNRIAEIAQERAFRAGFLKGLLTG